MAAAAILDFCTKTNNSAAVFELD